MSKKRLEEEFSFVWYKELKCANNITYYTKPFRTKVTAKNEKEAKEKAVQFALSSMKLVIMTEEEYNKSKVDLSVVQESIDVIEKQMSKIGKEFNKFFKKVCS